MAVDVNRHKAGIAEMAVLSLERLAEEFGNRQSRSPWLFQEEFLRLALAPEAGNPEVPEASHVAGAVADTIDITTEELSIARIQRAHGNVRLTATDDQIDALLPYFEG